MKYNYEINIKQSLHIDEIEWKKMRCMGYVVCSQPKRKLVIDRLTKRHTHKMTFYHFFITGKNIKKLKKENQSNIENWK